MFHYINPMRARKDRCCASPHLGESLCKATQSFLPQEHLPKHYSIPGPMGEQENQQHGVNAAIRVRLAHIERGLRNWELSNLSATLMRRLGEDEPVAISVALLCRKKSRRLVVALFALVKNGGLMSARLDTTATKNSEQSSFENMTLSMSLEALLAKINIGPGSIGVCDSGLYEYSEVCHMWKPTESTLAADLSRIGAPYFCHTAAAAKLSLCWSEAVYSPVMERNTPIENFARVIGTNSLTSAEQALEILESTAEADVPDLAAEADVITLTCPGSPITLTAKRNVLIIELRPMDTLGRHKFFANIFATLDQWRLPVCGIATSAGSVTVSLHSKAPLVTGDREEDYEITDDDLYGAVQDLRCHGRIKFLLGMAIVSVVDRQKSQSSVLAENVVSTLENNNIDIATMSHCRSKLCCLRRVSATLKFCTNMEPRLGASEGSIFCATKATHVRRAIGLLNEYLFPTEQLHSVLQFESGAQGVQSAKHCKTRRGSGNLPDLHLESSIKHEYGPE